MNNTPKDWFIANKIKERYASLVDNVKEEGLSDMRNKENISLTLPDGSRIEINQDIRNLPKSLFSRDDNHDPELLDIKFKEFTNKIDPFILKDLKKKIYCVGGLTEIKDFGK